MDNSWTVYMHIAPNRKVYVGITSQPKPEYRWGRDGIKYKNNKHFWNAIQKYGWDNFIHKIIQTGLTHEEAKGRERVLISKYKSNEIEFGYNQTVGGDGTYGYKHKPESIEKMKNKIFSQETRKKISEAAKERTGKKNSFFCKHHSNETKERIRIRRVGLYCKEMNPNVKPVDQFSKCGEYIRSFWGGKEASDLLGINKAHISQCCHGQRKSAGGYVWKFSKQGDDVVGKEG